MFQMKTSFSVTWNLSLNKVEFEFKNMSDFSENHQTFKAIDYAVFAAMLLVSSCIGLYFGVKGRSKKNKLDLPQSSDAVDYLLGGKNVDALPGEVVSLSLNL